MRRYVTVKPTPDWLAREPHVALLHLEVGDAAAPRTRACRVTWRGQAVWVLGGHDPQCLRRAGRPTTASNQIKALLVGAQQDLREQILVKSLLQLATRCSQLAPSSGLNAALGSLGRRWL